MAKHQIKTCKSYVATKGTLKQPGGVWDHTSRGGGSRIADFIIRSCQYISDTDGTFSSKFVFRTKTGRLASVVVNEEDCVLAPLSKALRKMGYRWPKDKSAQSALMHHLDCDAEKTVYVTNNTGWSERFPDTFALHDRSIGGHAGALQFQSYGSKKVPTCVAGSFLGWKTAVDRILPFTKSGLLAMGATLGSPFYAALNIEAGGFNLVGPPGGGKTTLGIMCVSVYGRSSREGLMSFDFSDRRADQLRCYYDCLAAYFDDMARAGRTVAIRLAAISAFIFRLTTSSSRMVDQHNSTYRDMRHGRLTLLTSSVKSLKEMAEKVGSHQFTGEEARLICVQAVASPELGVFNSCPPGFSTTRDAVFALETACSENYGHAGRRYIKRITDDRAAAESFMRKRRDFFIKTVGASGTQGRFADRFALAYAGLCLGSKFKIINIDRKLALKAVKDCYTTALSMAPVNEEQLQSALASLRSNITSGVGVLDATVGKVSETEYESADVLKLKNKTYGNFYGLKFQSLAAVSNSPLPNEQIRTALLKRNLLRLYKGGKSSIPVRVPGLKKRQRLLVLTAGFGAA